MMRRQIKKCLATVLCLGVAISVSACGKTGQQPESTVHKERAASVDNGSLSADSGVVSVGRTIVTYKEYKVYDYLMKSQYEDVLDTDVWTYTPPEEQESIGQEAIEDVVRLIIQIKVIGKAAASQGIELAADEKEEADHNAQECFASLPQEKMEQDGITQNLLSQIFEEHKLAEKMYNVVTGQVDVNLTQEQSNAARVQLIFRAANGQNKEEVRQQMQALAEQAKSLKGNFYKFARENTQSDEVECLVGQLDERSNLVNTVLGMQQYEMSGVIEESDGFYIAYCVEPTNSSIIEEYKNQAVEEKQVKAFQDAYAEWSKGYSVRVSRSLLANE